MLNIIICVLRIFMVMSGQKIKNGGVQMALSNEALAERRKYYNELHRRQMETESGRQKYEQRMERYWLRKAAERRAREAAEASATK